MSIRWNEPEGMRIEGGVVQVLCVRACVRACVQTGRRATESKMSRVLDTIHSSPRAFLSSEYCSTLCSRQVVRLGSRIVVSRDRTNNDKTHSPPLRGVLREFLLGLSTQRAHGRPQERNRISEECTSVGRRVGGQWKPLNLTSRPGRWQVGNAVSG